METKQNVREVLEALDAIKPNEIADSVKISWLSDINGKILCEICGFKVDELPNISGEEDCLSVPVPYSRLYLLYLIYMIDFCGGDSSGYEKTKKEFDNAYNEYAKWYIRNK